MRHAGGGTLKKIEPLLDEIRKSRLKEKKVGVFYLGGATYLHFHEDAAGIFADVKKKGSEWQRFKVPAEKKQWKKFAKKLTPQS